MPESAFLIFGFFWFLWIEVLRLSIRPNFRLWLYLPEEEALDLNKFWRSRLRIILFLLLLFSYILYSISDATDCASRKLDTDWH